MKQALLGLVAGCEFVELNYVARSAVLGKPRNLALPDSDYSFDVPSSRDELSFSESKLLSADKSAY